MKDRYGVRLQAGDRVRVQTIPDGPVSVGEVIHFHHRSGPLGGFPLVRFESGSAYFMNGEHLAIDYCPGTC